MYFPETMVDIETTGTSPDRTGILQIAAVRFNLETFEVDPNVFDMALALPSHRFWDESTREWWGRQKASVLEEIINRAQPAEAVMNEFFKWACETPGNRFWAKPITFDFTFVASYFKDYNIPNPYEFRKACDVNTFIRARHHPGQAPNIKIEGLGDAHNAKNDCFMQIGMLFKHLEMTGAGPKKEETA